MTEIMNGIDELTKYVEWYEETEECNEKADTLSGILTLKPGSGRDPYWRWSDRFGDIFFQEESFTKLINYER